MSWNKKDTTTSSEVREYSMEEVVDIDYSHETETKSNMAQEHFRSLTTALQDEFETLEIKKKDVKKEADALKKEKKQMQSMVDGEDIVYLNIGGDMMSCSRSTLCQVKDSLLASMFSGRWEDGLKKDKHGNVFLDFNPVCFRVILNYLRAKRIETPRRKAKKPTPPVNEEDNFWNLASYLGLLEELQTFPESTNENTKSYEAVAYAGKENTYTVKSGKHTSFNSGKR